MKEINFIKSISPQRQESLNRWLKLSIILNVLLLLMLLLVTAYQTQKLFSIKQRHQSAQQTIGNLETDLQKQEVIKKEAATLNIQQTKITKLKTNPKSPDAYLRELSVIIPADVSITNYKQLPDKIIELEGTALHINAATSFLNVLNQSAYFEKMQLISLQHHKQENNDLIILRFMIKGRIT